MKRQTIINVTGDFYYQNETMTAKMPVVTKSTNALFQDGDLNIVNLEAPITNYGSAINKTGPCLKQSDSAISVLSELNVNLVTLANNHLMDFGVQGYEDTINALTAAKIMHVGAGDNIKSASKPQIIEKNGFKIGVINICESEWSIADEECSGSNPIDLIENTQQILETKNSVDFLMLIIHGGHEYYNLPSPRIKNLYRYYAQIGADIVIGHHPHCYSGYEIHQNTPIFYSLGNFLFTKKSNHTGWYTGLILQIRLDETARMSWKLIPVEQARLSYSLLIPEANRMLEILNEVDRLSEIISCDLALLNEWKNFIAERENTYFQMLSITNAVSNKYLRFILRKFGLSRLTLNRRLLSYYLNLLRCESHNDLAKHIVANHLRMGENIK